MINSAVLQCKQTALRAILKSLPTFRDNSKAMSLKDCLTMLFKCSSIDDNAKDGGEVLFTKMHCVL